MVMSVTPGDEFCGKEEEKRKFEHPQTSQRLSWPGGHRYSVNRKAFEEMLRAPWLPSPPYTLHLKAPHL